MNYFPISDLIDGGIYWLGEARNFSVGIYSAEDHSFTGRRHKFGSVFLDQEFHWDLGHRQHGTAKPTHLLEYTRGLEIGDISLEYLWDVYEVWKDELEEE